MIWRQYSNRLFAIANSKTQSLFAIANNFKTNITIKKREKPLNSEGFLRFFASADEIFEMDIAFFKSKNAKKIEEKWAVFIVTKGISL